MTANGAAREGANSAVMARKVPGRSTDQRALDAAFRLRRRARANHEQHQRKSSQYSSHMILSAGAVVCPSPKQHVTDRFVPREACRPVRIGHEAFAAIGSIYQMALSRRTRIGHVSASPIPKPRAWPDTTKGAGAMDFEVGLPSSKSRQQLIGGREHVKASAADGQLGGHEAASCDASAATSSFAR
jgi:hypothetical protein